MGMLVAGCLALGQSAEAGYVLGMNFTVSKPTTISALGAFDGGTGFTSYETVGIFNDLTGDLVGPEMYFGPGYSGTQVGNSFYETVPTPFTLSPGEYSIMALSTGDSNPGGSSLSGGNSYEDLGESLNLPGGERISSGTSFTSPNAADPGSPNQAFDMVDPRAPDGGTTVIFLGLSLAGLSWLRRKA